MSAPPTNIVRQGLPSRSALRVATLRAVHALLDELNVAKDGTLVVPSEYLEVVITKKR